jgi:hypothetical protein
MPSDLASVIVSLKDESLLGRSRKGAEHVTWRRGDECESGSHGKREEGNERRTLSL